MTTMRFASLSLLKGVADVVEQAADGEVALQLARDLRPDLIVMDISMPGRMGSRRRA